MAKQTLLGRYVAEVGFLSSGCCWRRDVQVAPKRTMMSRQSKDPVQKCHSDPDAASTGGTPCSPGKRISRRLVPGIPSSSNTRKCVLTLDGYSYVIGEYGTSIRSKLLSSSRVVKGSLEKERKEAARLISRSRWGGAYKVLSSLYYTTPVGVNTPCSTRNLPIFSPPLIRNVETLRSDSRFTVIRNFLLCDATESPRDQSSR